MRLLLACSLLFAFAQVACSDDTGTGGNNAGGQSAGGGSSTGGNATGGNGPTTCTSAAECNSDAVCDPTTGMCVVDKPCTTHTECGGAAFCNGGLCAHNTPGGACDDTVNCVSGETCTAGVCGCGGEVYGADNVPPNVMIVLDRSSSMTEQISGGTKWDVARAAINQLIATHGNDVRFGLKLYPGVDLAGDPGMACGPGLVFVDPADGTGPAITSTLMMANTSSGTPTAEALTTLVGYAPLQDATRNNYILLITDGQSNCADPIPVVANILAQTPSVRTFVVGFGTGVDPAELDAMALAGGTAGPNMPYYFQADDAAALDAAFSTIVGSVLSCSYALSEVPPDPNQLYVWIDGMLVAADPANGWTYDPVTNQINFVGTTCDALQSGTAGELIVSYGCPSPPIPQ